VDVVVALFALAMYALLAVYLWYEWPWMTPPKRFRVMVLTVVGAFVTTAVAGLMLKVGG